MLEQIATEIVVFLLGALMTYLLGKWSGLFKEQDAVKFGVQSILRDRMCQMRRYYTDKKKPIPQHEMDSFEQMYKAYEDLGGNGYMKQVKRDLEAMPRENH